jgi:hypothetical protein
VATDHDPEALALLALGTPNESYEAAVGSHLADCERCRQELSQLREITEALGDVPPEMFLDGPPEGGDLLVQRALTQIRREQHDRGRLRRLATIAVAASAVLLALAGGLLVGLKQGQQTVVASPEATATATAAQPQPPGTKVASHTDAVTGAKMTVRIVPAIGWVRLNAAVTGIPAGERCRIWVIAADGRREQAGSWRVSEIGASQGTTLDAVAAVPLERVAAVEVDNFAGHKFVTVTL